MNFLRKIISKLFWGFFRHLLSDKLYTKVRYWLEVDKKLNLNNPRLFTEKIQYIKLFDQRAIRKLFANRVAVRDYVADKIGDEHLIPLIGNYDELTQDNWDNLPEQFVLKANHGSGMVEIIKEKKKNSFEKIHTVTKEWQRTNYYRFGREWAYKNLPRTIVAENLLLNSQNEIPKDYKFFCFSGNVELIQVDLNRFGKHKQNLFDRNFNRIDGMLLDPPYSGTIPKPDLLDKAINLAEILSDGINFVRVDLYLLKNKIYFGELTNYPLNGFVPFKPEELEQKMGALIKL